MGTLLNNLIAWIEVDALQRSMKRKAMVAEYEERLARQREEERRKKAEQALPPPPSTGSHRYSVMNALSPPPWRKAEKMSEIHYQSMKDIPISY